MKKTITIYITVAVASMAFSKVNAQNNIAGSLDMYVFPANDQDKDQQEFDEFKCYQWAKEQTGVDPINPPEVEAEQVNTGPDGSAVRGAAGGAAAGAAIGAIAGDAGKGAAIGATVGALRGRRARAYNNAKQQQQAEQQAAEQEAALINSFKKAFSACLEGKGYSVK